MAEPVTTPNSNYKMIVNGLPELDFYIWMEAITSAVNNLQPLTGSGTPEASVVASVGRWYVDTSAGAGSGIYFKETGDGNTGWVQRS